MEKDKVQSLLDSSGFPFQNAVEQAVRNTSLAQEYKVISSEHPWRDPMSGESGYIDLILEYGTARIVVECKRPRGGVWLFTVPHKQPENVVKSRLCWQSGSSTQAVKQGVSEFNLQKAPFESSECIILGSGENDRTLLERLGGTVLSSIDSLLREDGIIRKTQQIALSMIYIPCIVTSAEIVIVKYDPSKVSLEDGQINNFIHDTVPFIKFHKSMVSEISSTFNPKTLAEARNERERTILAVNARHFIETLSETFVNCRTGSDGIMLF